MLQAKHVQIDMQKHFHKTKLSDQNYYEWKIKEFMSKYMNAQMHIISNTHLKRILMQRWTIISML